MFYDIVLPLFCFLLALVIVLSNKIVVMNYITLFLVICVSCIYYHLGLYVVSLVNFFLGVCVNISFHIFSIKLKGKNRMTFSKGLGPSFIFKLALIFLFCTVMFFILLTNLEFFQVFKINVITTNDFLKNLIVKNIYLYQFFAVIFSSMAVVLVLFFTLDKVKKRS